MLELIPQLPEADHPRFEPWASHLPVADTPPTLSPAEQDTLNTVTAANAAGGAP